MIRFTVFAEPVAKARARVCYNQHLGRAISYTPKKTANFETLVAGAAEYHRPKSGLLTGPIWLDIVIYRSIPKSMSKRKAALAEAGEIRPATRPDGDNYEKAVCDALSGLIWKDDGQIVDCRWQKYYSVTPRVVVAITEGGAS